MTKMTGLAALFAVAVGVNGCNHGDEGDRCNPDLSHNPCNDGLTCWSGYDPVAATFCGESYCCPNPPSASTAAACNGTDSVSLSDGAACLLLYPQGGPALTSSGEGGSSGASSGDGASARGEGDSGPDAAGRSESEAAADANGG